MAEMKADADGDGQQRRDEAAGMQPDLVDGVA